MDRPAARTSWTDQFSWFGQFAYSKIDPSVCTLSQLRSQTKAFFSSKINITINESVSLFCRQFWSYRPIIWAIFETIATTAGNLAYYILKVWTICNLVFGNHLGLCCLWVVKKCFNYATFIVTSGSFCHYHHHLHFQPFYGASQGCLQQIMCVYYYAYQYGSFWMWVWVLASKQTEISYANEWIDGRKQVGLSSWCVEGSVSSQHFNKREKQN